MTSQWQPIETAPNDAVLTTDGEYCLAASRHDGKWYSGWNGGDWHFRVEIIPTHWMPLPTPPETDDARPDFTQWVWSEQDKARLNTIYKENCEHHGIYENLFAIAAEGIRIYCERMARNEGNY